MENTENKIAVPARGSLGTITSGLAADVTSGGQLFRTETDEFALLMMRYNSAIREVRTKLEILNDDLALSADYNPITSIESRCKTPGSIYEKLVRQHNEISVASIERNLNDVAGVRVICSFVDDIYKIAKMLVQQDDVKLVRIKDYIKHPKANGYRSYHMIIEIPVYFSDEKRSMRVEVQIRTVAMDFWANLEHKMKYKKHLSQASVDAIYHDLRECADTIADTDLRMLSIREHISELEQKQNLQ